MDVEQALRALAQMREAAPPATSARLGEMISLVRDLQSENIELQHRLNEAERRPLSDPMTALMPTAFDTLRAMLIPLQEQSQVLQQGKYRPASPEMLDSVQTITDHSAAANRLLHSLDEIAMLRRGTFQLAPLVFSGLDLLADAWQTNHEAAEERKQDIYVYADDPLPFVQGDYHSILGILCDLLDNAIHYSGPGKLIRLTAETLGTHVLFSIADEGIGLSSEDLGNIGQPYWRALRHPQVRNYPGAGLRLHIAQQVLALHETELLFSGEAGTGSTFSFVLAAE